MRGFSAALVMVGLMVIAFAGGEMMTLEHSRGAVSPPTPFEELMARAMERMHGDMAMAPSGNPDRDFAAMMIPHHQGAIDMAEAELAYGREPVLKRLAQGIVVEQTQEIEVMRRALATLPPARNATTLGHHQGAADTTQPVQVHGETAR